MLRNFILTRGIPAASYFGYPLGKAFSLLRTSERWTREEIQKHQARALRNLVEHCYHHVPYYRKLMKSKNLHPDDIKTVHDLAKFPYLTRDNIRKEGEGLRADNYPDKVCQFRRSGGTTGEPIKIALDIRARAFEVAAYLRGYQWMNCRLGNPQVRLFGGSLGLSSNTGLRVKLKEWLYNSHLLPAFEMRQENVEDYIDVVRRAKEGILVGYASAVLNLAEHMSGRHIQGSPLRSVILTSEHIPEEWRIFVSQVFGAPVFCYYGCGEVNSLGYECKGEEGYIVPQEHVILEVGGEDSTVLREEGRGEACITTLFNYAMPLIRYLNSDVLALKYPQKGRKHLRILRLEGRIMDQLTATDGHSIGSVLPTYMVQKSGVPVWKYQVVQTSAREIVFHYLLRDNAHLSTEDKDMLKGMIRRYLGSDMAVKFVIGEFETTRSGKHRFAINRVTSSG